MSFRCAALAVLVMSGVMAIPASAQGKLENRGLSAMSLSGERVALLPLTMVVADSAVESDSLYTRWRNRAYAVALGDSLIFDAFETRAPEITWVPPAELRRIARRAPGMVTNPDQMGQAMLRSPKLQRLPDQLATSLRRLVAISGGRMVLVPAAVAFNRTPSGQTRAEVSLALVDTRRNEVVWRSVAAGESTAPDRALRNALLTVFPEP